MGGGGEGGGGVGAGEVGFGGRAGRRGWARGAEGGGGPTAVSRAGEEFPLRKMATALAEAKAAAQAPSSYRGWGRDRRNRQVMLDRTPNPRWCHLPFRQRAA